MSCFLSDEEANKREQQAPLNKIILKLREDVLKDHDKYFIIKEEKNENSL